MSKIQNGCPRETGGSARVCVRASAWISGDPLPGHRASSTPGCAVGAVVGRPWPASPGCSPPAGAPGPGCPFPCCAAAVAASSPARAACAAQPSDWTSRQRETSSANTHSEQPCRHDNLSIHRSIHPFFVLFRQTLFLHPRTPVCQAKFGEIGRKVRGGGKKSEKSFAASSRRQRTTWCDVFTSGSLPPPSRLSCQLYRLALHVPLLSLQICPPRLILGSAYKRAASLGYASKLVGVSHLAAATTQCPMLCAWQHVKIGLGNDYDDYYKPKLEKKWEERWKEKVLKYFWYCIIIYELI